ncbi:MAG: helix-turn-helix transcriptional regulator [Planctomycetota bacterium]
MPDEQPITDALKNAIEASGMSIKSLERETGVSRQSMMHFMRGTRTLRLDIADKLATYFGLELRPATRKATTKAAPKRKGK